MNCHSVLLFCKMVSQKSSKCLKLNVSGEVCGKLPGTCIHDWKPGARK